MDDAIEPAVTGVDFGCKRGDLLHIAHIRDPIDDLGASGTKRGDVGADLAVAQDRLHSVVQCRAAAALGWPRALRDQMSSQCGVGLQFGKRGVFGRG